MVKKLLLLVSICLLITLNCVSIFAASKDPNAIIDTSNASKGFVTVQYKEKASSTIKAQVAKGDIQYNYVLKDTNAVSVPLQSGAGTYKIIIGELVGGKSFKVLASEEITVDKLNDKDVYTNSIQLVYFNGKMTSIADLNKLVANAKTDSEKVKIIYEYVIENFKYDFDKAAAVAGTSDYIPSNDAFYASKKGICYDYASLFASILRANNIPSKLEMGYYTKIEQYHAWNEVYVDDKWMIIDTTYDAQAKEYKIDYKMKKDNSEFKIIKQY